MRKNLTINGRRRPSVDSLESRCLLSGIIEVIEVHPVPALIVGIEVRPIPLPLNGYGNGSLAGSPLFGGQEGWGTPEVHHDFSPMGGYSSPDLGFRSYPEPQMVSAYTSSNGDSESPGTATPNAQSMAPAPGPVNHDTVPPGAQPSPGPQPPFMFMGGDLDRFMHAMHDPSMRPPPNETTPSPPESTSQTDSNSDSDADEVTVASTGVQSGVQAQGGTSTVQTSPSFLVSPGNLTALFKPTTEHDDQSLRAAKSDESPGNPAVEAAPSNLPVSASASLVPTDPATDLARLGGADSASVVDGTSISNQTKLLLPQAAGLIANAVPFDQAALEKAVDQFFDQLESLGVGQLVEPGPTRVIPLSLALLGTVTAVEVARRRLKSPTGQRKAEAGPDHLSSEELLGYPELPGSWSTNLT